MSEKTVQLVEVGPRDGLQNEDVLVSTGDKLKFIELLSEAGYRRIEVTSFVHPKWVPQLADARDLYRKLPRVAGVCYTALVPNVKGMETALEVGVQEIAVFSAASETFNRKNINMSIKQSFAAIAAVAALAQRENIPVRGYLSTSFGCPYEGRIPEGRISELTLRLLELGCYEVSISDTIGVAAPGDVDRVLSTVLQNVSPEQTALHFHDTRGMALANVVRALDYGVRIFDGAAGGAGGCPFAPGAAGNVASEDLVYLLEGMGIETNISLPKLLEASCFLEDALKKDLPSRVLHSPKSPILLADEN